MFFSERNGILSCVTLTLCVLCCVVVVIDYLSSKRAEEYPAGFVCWASLCAAGANFSLLIFMLGWFFSGTCDNCTRDADLSDLAYFGVSYGVSAELLWSCAWCFEMCRKIRNPLESNRTMRYHILVWLGAFISPFLWWMTEERPQQEQHLTRTSGFWIDLDEIQYNETMFDIDGRGWRVGGLYYDRKKWNMHLIFDKFLLLVGLLAIVMQLVCGAYIGRKAWNVSHHGRRVKGFDLGMYFVYVGLFVTVAVSAILMSYAQSTLQMDIKLQTLLAGYVMVGEGFLLPLCRLVEVHRCRRVKKYFGVTVRESVIRESMLGMDSTNFAIGKETSTGHAVASLLTGSDVASLATTLLKFMGVADGEVVDCSNTFKTYAAVEFASLRNHWNVNLRDHVAELKKSLTAKPFKKAGGKSGALFHLCPKLGLVIKVEAGDGIAKAVEAIAPGYAEHMRSYPKSQESLLVRIYGAFVTWTGGGGACSVLLMEFIPGDMQYDVKGKAIKCGSNSDEKKLVGKLAPSNGPGGNPLARELIHKLHGEGAHESGTRFPQLESALKVLRVKNRTDYSLLIKFTEQSTRSSIQSMQTGSMRVRIIDFLQEYNLAKKSEHAAKASLCWFRENAILPPNEYAERMMDFMCEALPCEERDYTEAARDHTDATLPETELPIRGPNLLPEVASSSNLLQAPEPEPSEGSDDDVRAPSWGPAPLEGSWMSRPSTHVEGSRVSKSSTRDARDL